MKKNPCKAGNPCGADTDYHMVKGGGRDMPMTRNQTAASSDDYSKSNPTGADLNPKAINRQGSVKKSKQPCGPTRPNPCGPH